MARRQGGGPLAGPAGLSSVGPPGSRAADAGWLTTNAPRTSTPPEFVRRRADPALASRAARARAGPRPVRRPYAHRVERPGRLHVLGRRAARGPGGGRRVQRGVPDARARWLPGRERHGHRGRRRVRRAADGVLPARPARRPPCRDGALPERGRPRDQAAPARRAVPARQPPELEPVFALADERNLPVLVHAGRGIPALGRHALAVLRAPPGAPPDPGALRDLRPGMDLARDRRASQPVLRHRLVGAHRPAGAVRPGRAGPTSSSPATPPTGPRRSPPRCTCATRCRPG